MNNTKLKQFILDVLKADEILWNKDKTELNQTLLLDLIEHFDETIIELLLQEKELRDKFFVKIKDVYVFKTNDFRFFMEENKVDNSYTQYKNRIGLTDGKKFLKDTNDVVLNWPYKDCVLEGGQSTEEGSDTYFEYSEKTKQYETKQGKRKEIFFNSVLAHDEIDRLFDHKALTNWKRFTKDGEKEVGEIKRDEDGTIRENLIIKGNNLLALHSLKKQFAGKVKLIYIDPPYNTGNDGFKYNDNFNHSTWLTFMKNRLEIAKELLRDDGVIYISIDHHENHYLKVLCDEIFQNGLIQDIVVESAAPAGFKLVNPGPVKVTEYILVYAKNKQKYISQEKNLFVKGKYPINYNQYIKNIEDNYKKWEIINIKEVAIEKLGFSSLEELKNKYGEISDILLNTTIEKIALEKPGSVFTTYKPHNPAPKLKSICDESIKNKDEIFIYNDKYYVLNGRLIAFYSNKLKKIDGEIVPSTHLTNLWNDLTWSGVSSEGGVMLNNAKKPEALIKRIIELSTEKYDIVLDYHLGTGTTCAVAHKMGRQYIGIEQLDYGENDSIVRLQNVINGDQSGISKSVNWQGGGDFIYFELAKWNETAKEKIFDCESLEELEAFFDEMYERYFLNYNLKIKEFKEKVLQEENFRNLSLDEQKKIFVAMLDNNQMYVNKTEMADKKFGISEEDQNLTNQFYNS
jgi:adenine-specific DNA-methyltransferase